MPFNIFLQDERGTVLESIWEFAPFPLTDPTDPEFETFHCLRFIDQWGDTVFNQLQMGRFLQELDRMEPESTPEQRRLLAEVRRLAERCRDGVQTQPAASSRKVR